MISRYFECINVEENKSRFFNVHLEKTSNGFSVVCQYGRITSWHGHESEKQFTDFGSAVIFFDRVVKTRFAYGYKETYFIPIFDSLLNERKKLTQKDIDAIRRAGL